jgi:Na+/H+ antiporter NhaD/arsenite permease-like protein
MKRPFVYIVALLISGLITALLGLTLEQTLSATIFMGIILGTLVFWKFRLAFALIGMTGLIALGLIDIPQIIEFAGLDIILFLIGMMIVVGFLEERHFFEHLVDRIVGLVGSNGRRLTVALMVLAAVFAALVDEVTSILFMTSTVLHLTSKRKLNPLPFVIMIVFATNIGSSATVVGNPVGIMVAMRAGLTFTDFLRWATPITILALCATIPLSLKIFHRDVRKLDEELHKVKTEEEKVEEISSIEKKQQVICWILFAGTIVSLVMHSSIESLLGLQKNTMLLGTSLGAAGIALLMDFERARELVERRVDWWTLSFFVLLFASVGTLRLVGLTGVLASQLNILAGGSEVTLMIVFMWGVGVLSAFMDNVLAVATFIPILQDLHTIGVSTFSLWWGMLFAGTFFGNLTMIGSTANIVAIGMLERRKLGFLSLADWIKPGAIVSVVTLLIATVMLYLQMPLMPR